MRLGSEMIYGDEKMKSALQHQRKGMDMMMTETLLEL